MKRICSIILLALFLSVGVFAQDALAAAKVNIINDNNGVLRVVVAYYSTTNKKMRTVGRYNVQPRTTRALNFSDIGEEVYIHAPWAITDGVKAILNGMFAMDPSTIMATPGTTLKEQTDD